MSSRLMTGTPREAAQLILDTWGAETGKVMIERALDGVMPKKLRDRWTDIRWHFDRLPGVNKNKRTREQACDYLLEKLTAAGFTGRVDAWKQGVIVSAERFETED